MTNAIVQDKMQKEIVVIANTTLFAEQKRFQGILPHTVYNMEDYINKNYSYMVRGEAEQNTDYKQPIGYSVLIHKASKEIFVYKRGGAQSVSADKRLHDKISRGVGGHTEKNLINDFMHPVREAAIREVEEETGYTIHNHHLSILAYINDDSNDVGKVHIGIFYVANVQDKRITMEDGELAEGSFKTIDEVESMIASGTYDVETRSLLIFPLLKEYIESL